MIEYVSINGKNFKSYIIDDFNDYKRVLQRIKDVKTKLKKLHREKEILNTEDLDENNKRLSFVNTSIDSFTKLLKHLESKV